jgi:hypothetical protein
MVLNYYSLIFMFTYLTSQEDIRQLETLRQLFMTNNNIGASPLDLTTIIASNSPAEIKHNLKFQCRRTKEKYQQQQQLEQQKIDNDKEIAQEEMAREDNNKQLDRESKENIAYITTFARQKDNDNDDNGDGVPDVLEYDKLSASVDASKSKEQIERDKQQLEREKLIAQRDASNREIS